MTCLAIFSQVNVFALTATTITLTASPNPSNYGQAVSLTAAVTAGATGKVTFYGGVTILGVGTLVGSQATLSSGMLPSGDTMLRAHYGGDTSYAPANSAPLPHTVTPGISLGFKNALQQTMSVPVFTAAIGDINGDGIQDLVTANYNSSNVSVFLGNGKGSFRAVGTIAAGSPHALALGDFNGDGKADVAVTDNYAGTVNVLLGNGDGTFQAAVPYTVGSSPWSLAVGDFNGDGKSDIVVVNTSSGNLSVLLGNGDGTFASAVSYPTPPYPTSITTGDLNGDGVPDLVVCSESGVSVLLGNGDGTFRASVDYPLGNCVSPVVRDFNGDGIADVAVINNTSSGQISVLLGNGDNTLQAPLTSTSFLNFYSSLAVEDFDGDGIPDLAVADSLGLGILLGNGDGSFQPEIHYPAANVAQFVTVGEFNGDGIADVLLIDGNSWGFFVFLGGAAPDLGIAASRFGGLTQGQAGAAYTITVSNSGPISSSSAVHVAVSLPPAFLPVSLSGSGWLCNISTLICTRSDPLAAGATYSPVTLRFNISSQAGGNVTATFSVSGGGDRNTANNQVSDTAFIRSATATVLLSSPNPAVLGHTVTLTATVTAGATGIVTFFDGAMPIGSAPVSAGQAVLTTSLLPSGSQPLYATYGGDSNYGPSSSATDVQNIVAVQSNDLWSSHSYPAAAASWVVTGDFNGDDIPDLVSGGILNNGGSIAVLLGKGDGTFAPKVTYTMSDTVNSLLAADFNGDGKLDLAVATNGGFDVLLGNGDGTFRVLIQMNSGGPFTSLAAADVNGDGIPDIVAVYTTAGGSPTLFLGNGDGTFQPPAVITEAQFDYFAMVDLNGDGKPDLVGLESTNGIVAVLLGHGDGTFGPTLTTSVLANQTDILAVGDFNGDGKPDVAIVSWQGIQALLGNGDGTFQAPIHSALNVVSSSFATTGDFNGDGKLDIAYTGYSGDNHVHLAFGNGDGTFQAGISLATDAVPANIAQGDFNGDGTLDLAVSNYATAAIDVLLGGQNPSLSVALSHEGNFTIGSAGSYTLTVENPAPQNTGGTVKVSDTLPAGLTATAIGGSGWFCTLSTLTCVRSDSLSSAASYPVITVAVSVSASLSPSTVINHASVSYQSTLSNATDSTTLVLVSSTSLTVSSQPATLGESVTLTATVTPAAAGTVAFSDGGTFLGTAPLSGGVAVFSTNLLPSGRQTLFAAYAGNSTYAKSASAGQVLNVNAAIAGGFSAPAFYSTDIGSYAVALGDFNGDGKPDLVTANSTANTVSVLLGHGDGTFGAPVNYAVGQQPVAVAVGDFNNDGVPDLAVANDFGSSVSILLGNGDGTFRAALNFPANLVPISVVVGDFNRDGNADLAVAVSGGVEILFGNGDGTFRASATTITTYATSNLIVGDFNNDGIADLAYAYQGYRIYTLLGNGDGTFRAGIYSSAASTSGLAAGDLNGDGNTDVVAPDVGGVAVNLGNGDGTFQPYVHYATGTSPKLVTLADVNGDGKLDVIAVNTTAGTVSVLLGNGDGTLQSPFTYAAGTSPSGIVAGDFNGDGRTDIAVADSQKNGVSVLLGTLTSVLSVISTHNGMFALGQIGVTYSITVTNGGPQATSGTVAVTDTLPAGFTATAISGQGWTCTLSTLTCTRPDALAVAASYPAITVTANVALTGEGIVSNQVSVSGGGAAPASGSDPTGITVGTTITIQTNPEGLAFTIDGAAPQIAPQTLIVPGEQHTLAVAATQAGSPGVQYVFTGWSDFGAASHTINLGFNAETYIATFQTQYELTIAANPVPGGTITPASGVYYNPGSTVAVIATPVSPYIFDSWSGGITSTSNQVSATMNGPVSITATFSVPGFTCDIANEGSTNVVDVQAIVNQALGLAPPNNDMNRDGVIDVADVQKVIDAAMGTGCIY